MASSRLVYLISVLSLVQSNSEIKPCGDEAEEWIQYGTSCLVYVDKLLGFKEARRYCQGFLGGTADIVYDIEDHTENEFILNNIVKGDYAVWIGLTISGQNESNWIREDGGEGDTKGQFRNWIHTKPPFNGGKCSIMMTSGHWMEANCNANYPFVCKKASLDEGEDTTRRTVIFIGIPIVMVAFIVVFVIVLFQRSQQEIQKLKQRLASSDVLHLMISKPDPEHKKLNNYATKLLNGSTTKKKQQTTSTRSKDYTYSIDNKKLRRWSIFASWRENSQDLNLVTENRHTVLTLLGALGIEQVERSGIPDDDDDDGGGADSNRDNVFYIHDEVVSNSFTNADIISPFRRTKSERLTSSSRSEKLKDSFLHRSNSHVFSYEQRKSLILEDELIPGQHFKDTNRESITPKLIVNGKCNLDTDIEETHQLRQANRIKSLVHQKRLPQKIVLENRYTKTTRL